MHSNSIRLAAASLVLGAAALSIAQEVPRGSFIVTPVESRYQLVQHVQVEPVVMERYRQHFGMTQEEVVRYFSTLRTTTLPETTTYTVWYTRPQTMTTYSKQITLRQGEPVFVDQSGTVVLRLKCGNPLIDRTVARTYYDTVVVNQPVETTTTVVTTEERAQPLVTEVALQPIVTTHNLTWEDAAAVYLLSREMNVAPDAVVAMRAPELASTTFVDLAPALLMAWSGQRPVADVYGMYTGGTTWVDIANQLAFPGMYYNPMAVSTSAWSNADFSNNLWQTLLLDNALLPTSQFGLFGSQNVPLGQLLVASVIGNQLNIPASDVLTAYAASQGDWATLATNLIANPPVRSYIRLRG